MPLTTVDIAQLAKEAYLDESSINEADHLLGKATLRMFHAVDNCECFTGKFRTLSFVVIRGTSSSLDAKADSEFWKVPFEFTKAKHGVNFHGSGKVHRGLLRYAGMIIRSIILDTERLGNNRVLVTGHSLGGGIAQIIASVLGAMGYDVTLVTFGSLRAGNAAFARSVENSVTAIYRFVNYVDIVPRTPPLLFNYRHTKGLMYFDRSGTALEKLTWSWKCLDTCYGIWLAFKAKNPFVIAKLAHTHGMKPYLKLVTKTDEWRVANRILPQISLFTE